MTGHDILSALVGGDKEFNKLINFLDKVEDQQSGSLALEVWWRLTEALTLTSGQGEALSRLMGSVENAGRWQADLQRNNIFKAAHSLGIRLPSAMFANQKVAGATVTKRDLKLKNGDMIPKGTRAEVKYLGARDPHGTSLAHLILEWISPTTGRNYRHDPLKVSITRIWDMVGGVSKPPGISRLQRMSNDGVATTPSGKRVEPDGWGPDGSPSWLLVLGVV